MLNDLDGGQVWVLVEARKKEQVWVLLQELDAAQRAGAKAVVDSGALTATPWRTSCRRRTSCMTSSTSALVSTRRSTRCVKPSVGSWHCSVRQTLKGIKHLWLRNLPDLRSQFSFRQLYCLNLRTSRA